MEISQNFHENSLGNLAVIEIWKRKLITSLENCEKLKENHENSLGNLTVIEIWKRKWKISLET